MKTPRYVLPATLASMFLCVGCESEEQLKRVQQEVGDLKVEVFKLRQQVEEGNRKAEAERGAASETRDLERRFRADLQETLRQLQESTRSLGKAAATRGPAPRTAEPVAAPATEEEKALSSAVLDYNRGSYPLAAESLDLFLKANPASPRRPDALFYLGLCHYNLKAFDKAQGAFDQIIRDHAASQQFLPAKLKRAQCLSRMGLKPAAVRAFKELVEGFPGSAEARTAAQELGDLGL
jgi:TolA-binding protein